MVALLQAHLTPHQSFQTSRLGDLSKLHDPRDGVVIGQREGLVAELYGALDELLGKRGSIQERVSGVAVQLDVRRRR
jgi:hypothetical protein